MIVRNIVDSKSQRQIITIKPADLVRTATEILAKHRIGAGPGSGGGAVARRRFESRSDTATPHGISSDGCNAQGSCAQRDVAS